MRAADFSGRSIVLATMHGKERAFGPILADRLGMEIVVPPGLDTDTLGTFSGEVSRPGSMEETAIAKARLGASVAGCELALASEGAYGPHPTVPFVAAGLELVVLLDTRSGRVVREHLIDERPVYDHVTIEPGADLDAFLTRIGFPNHAVIARRPDRPDSVVKGIQCRDHLAAVVARLSGEAGGGPLFLQTDMRAHFNARRMETLGRLAEKLANRLATSCPACAAAGSGMTGTRKGLPCEWCSSPTELVATEVWACTDCGHSEDRARRDGLTRLDLAIAPAATHEGEICCGEPELYPQFP